MYRKPQYRIKASSARKKLICCLFSTLGNQRVDSFLVGTTDLKNHKKRNFAFEGGWGVLCFYKNFSLFQPKVGPTLGFLPAESNLESNLKETKRSWAPARENIARSRTHKYICMCAALPFDMICFCFVRSSSVLSNTDTQGSNRHFQASRFRNGTWNEEHHHFYRINAIHAISYWTMQYHAIP